MPVEIKELVIRAIAQKPDPDSKGCESSDSGCASGGSGGPVSDASVERTVQAVLRILRAKGER